MEVMNMRDEIALLQFSIVCILLKWLISYEEWEDALVEVVTGEGQRRK